KETPMPEDETNTLSLMDVLQPEYTANPYPLYHRLREHDPIYWDERAEEWVLTRHSDVITILRDPRLTAERFMLDTSWLPRDMEETLGPPIHALTRQMLFRDPPDHTRLRGLVSKAFAPRVLEAMRPRIQSIVDELLDAVQDDGGMEVIQAFAFPLPAIVIAQMLGVPPEDRGQFVKWTGDFGMLLSGVNLELQDVVRALYGVSEFMDYFRNIIKQRRTAPKDDLMQAMIAAEEQGDRLTEEELLGNCVLLLAAGHGTTTHLIGNGLLALLRNPDQMQLLKDNPGLIAPAVQELLRYDSPVQMTSRRAKEDITIGDKRIQAGQAVLMCLGAANRDPAVFPDPDRLDLRRQDNRHVAFGYGIHYCLGAPLARIEGEIAFNTLLRRLPNPRLATGEPEWAPNLVFRGLRSLPIEFD
ncbi:MAG TPA: cytochrome P450, partial [Ktedonobacteraceae bacterium]|nr:cytochrome P450 [Ktedonobacteraceae bacterium]